MSNRMKPKRLAEMDEHAKVVGGNMFELLQALKAEREKVEKLEAEVSALNTELTARKEEPLLTTIDKLERCIEELEATIKRVSKIAETMECDEWCGKSPTKDDDGRCPACKLQAELKKQSDE